MREIEVDLNKRAVRVSNVEVHLTPREYKLLAALVRNAGRVVTHRRVLHDVWGANYQEQTHYLRVYMAHLREKLEADAKSPRLFLTDPGIGYRLVPHE